MQENNTITDTSVRTPWWHRYTPTDAPSTAEYHLKWLLWLYVILWLSEGALRKWLLPQFSTPLLLVRDPVAAAILLYAIVNRVWRPNGWTLFLWVIGFGSSLFFLGTDLPYPILLIGLRTLCLHFPLIFVFARVLQRGDVLHLGNLFIDLALPMSVLMIAQYLAPADALINIGATAGLGDQLAGIDDHIRPPAVFSFVTGTAQYYWLTAAFIFDRLIEPRERSLAGLIPAALGCVFALSVSISRFLVAGTSLIVLVFALSYLRAGFTLRRLTHIIIVALAIVIALFQSAVVQDGFESFRQRWLDAGDLEGSFVARAARMFLVHSETVAAAGLAGKGLGLGTNMASYLMLGEKEFMLSEHEWARIILEMGYLLGFIFIAWRVALAARIGIGAIKAWLKNDCLAVLLFSAGCFSLLNGQSAQPATLGYIVLAAGLTLAASETQERTAEMLDDFAEAEGGEAEAESTLAEDRR